MTTPDAPTTVLAGLAHLAASRVMIYVNKVNTSQPDARRALRARGAYQKPLRFHLTVPVALTDVDGLLRRAWQDVEAGLPEMQQWPCLRDHLNARLRSLLVHGILYVPQVALDAATECREADLHRAVS